MKDIVERLRREKYQLKRDREDAALEIEELRKKIKFFDDYCKELFEEVERLREETSKKHNAYARDVSKLLSELRKTDWLTQSGRQDELF